MIEDLKKQWAALAAARFNGLREVRDADGSAITYKSDSEMARALAALDAQIAALSAGPAPSMIRLNSTKGL